MELLTWTMQLMQSYGFSDVGDDSDFCSSIDFELHVMSVHVDVASPGMALIRINGVQVCHIIHVIQSVVDGSSTTTATVSMKHWDLKWPVFHALCSCPFPLLRKVMEESSGGGEDL